MFNITYSVGWTVCCVDWTTYNCALLVNTNMIHKTVRLQ